MPVTSLLELIERLFSDGDAADAFRAAPDQFLADHGLDDLSGADVLDALSLGFGSVAPDLAGRLVLPAETGDASAADALFGLLDAAPATSVLDEADTGADALDFDFGLGDVSADATFGAGDPAVESNELDLDLGGDYEPTDDLDTATFDQGFGSGHGDAGFDHMHDVDDFDFSHGDDDVHDDLL